jgi:replicative DNA helicase
MTDNYEQKLLGLLIREPDLFADAQRVVNFERPFHSFDYNNILKEAKDLYAKTGQVDRRDLLMRFKEHNLTIESYTELIKGAGFRENLQDYVNTIHDALVKRELSLISHTLINCTDDLLTPADKYLNAIKSVLEGIESNSAVSCGVTLAEAVKNVSEKANRLSKGDLTDYIRTGVLSIDRLITGFTRKTMSVIGARPSVGKSALGLTLTANMLSANHNVGFISVEMSETECVERLMQVYSGVSIDEFKKTPVNKDKLNHFNTTGQGIAQLKNLEIVRTTDRTIMNIRSIARSMKRKMPDLDIIFIDYLQKITGTGKGQEKRNDVGEVSNILTDLANDLDIHVCCLAQLNRNSSETPKMMDLKESGEIEQDASYILLIGRDLAEQYNGVMDCDAQIYVCKNRQGRTGKVDIKYNCVTTRFYDDIEDDHGF